MSQRRVPTETGDRNRATEQGQLFETHLDAVEGLWPESLIYMPNLIVQLVLNVEGFNAPSEQFKHSVVSTHSAEEMKYFIEVGVVSLRASVRKALLLLDVSLGRKRVE